MTAFYELPERMSDSAPRVHPVVLELMEEMSPDLCNAQLQLLTDELAKTATLLVMMGCGNTCPHIPELRWDDWHPPAPMLQERMTNMYRSHAYAWALAQAVNISAAFRRTPALPRKLPEPCGSLLGDHHS